MIEYKDHTGKIFFYITLLQDENSQLTDKFGRLQ